MNQFPTTRLRRLRQQPKIRALVRETSLSVDDLIMPIFIKSGDNIRNPISSMPGQYQLSLDQLNQEIAQIQELGINGVILFGIPESKDPEGSAAWDDNGLIQTAIRQIKQLAPDLVVISDLCFCEYTDHGHCGVVNDQTGKMDVDNDATLELLARQAVSMAKAGADVIAPSGMMDGMVAWIRKALDVNAYSHLPILSYSVKYSSSMYGPFRDAAEGAPQFGDRSTYQMDPANAKEALREAKQDLQEGADMLMVKPALNYLDVIAAIKQQHPEVPLAAYQVSGEYAMVKAAADQGWLDEKAVALEMLLSIKRAGADFIISYFSKDVAAWLK